MVAYHNNCAHVIALHAVVSLVASGIHIKGSRALPLFVLHLFILTGTAALGCSPLPAAEVALATATAARATAD